MNCVGSDGGDVLVGHARIVHGPARPFHSRDWRAVYSILGLHGAVHCTALHTVHSTVGLKEETEPEPVIM